MSDYGVHVRLLRTELEQRVPVLRHAEGSRDSARRAAGVCCLGGRRCVRRRQAQGRSAALYPSLLQRLICLPSRRYA